MSSRPKAHGFAAHLGCPLPVMQAPRCQSQMTNLLPLFLFAAEKVVFGRPRGAPWRRFQCGSEPIGAENTHAEVEKAISAPAVPTSHACPTRCAPLQRRATNPKAVGDDRPHRQSKKCYGQRFVLPPKKERSKREVSLSPTALEREVSLPQRPEREWSLAPPQLWWCLSAVCRSQDSISDSVCSERTGV